MTTNFYQKLELLPHPQDQKQWIAEITGPDETYHVKREFLPLEEDHYRIYDGWYQIHGTFPSAQTPFTKEYCYVQDGQMVRNRSYRQTLSELDQITVFESKRVERLKDYIKDHLDDIYQQVPHEMVQEALFEQKDQLSFINTSSELYQGLHQLLFQKERYIKRFQEGIKKWHEFDQDA